MKLVLALAVIFSMLLTACSPAPIKTSELAGNWQLASFTGNETLQVQGDEPITLNFDSTKQSINGFAGCNRYFGQYDLSDGKLSFSKMGMTKMLCQENNEIELYFMEQLKSVAGAQIRSGKLQLTSSNGDVLLELTRG
ncbi:META domain-containing protein [Thalassotalea aquiviva]|uniref:META domain-containing protein n=1 Tax=Thalassotalea aquiviva TaxID=3242415 RepID=UPI00352B105C